MSELVELRNIVPQKNCYGNNRITRGLRCTVYKKCVVGWVDAVEAMQILLNSIKTGICGYAYSSFHIAKVLFSLSDLLKISEGVKYLQGVPQ